MKLMKHLYQVSGVSLAHSYDATAYLIEGSDGLYLLDCGTPDGYQKIISNIRSLGFDPKDIKAIYGTHGHYDHVGAAKLYKDDYGCRLYLHEEDVKQVEEGDQVKTTAEILYGRVFPPCPVDGTIGDGDRFDFGTIKMEVLHTPGHTLGSVCFALDCEGYQFLIAGDTIWGGFSHLIGSNEELWRKSLDKLTNRHFDGYTFGHVGANVIADADRRLEDAKKQFATYYNPWFKAMKDTFIY
ncbi:MAG: zn-dependent hydrolase including glyoxylase [Herbinix sp.]|nr:zn-dependent hydrolase including glyoxylase [Herbinix sp.]